MQLIPNQLVELHVEGSQGIGVYKTRVEDAYDDLLIVGAPIQQGTLVPLRVGTEIQVQFKMKSNVQEGRFSNRAIIEKRFRANLPLLQLRLLGKWEKTQERGFLRVPVSLDAVFVAYKEGEETSPQSAIMLDLSGGGFLLRSTYPLALDDKIRISFYIKDTQIIADANVVRLVQTESGMDYGFAFLDLPEQIRQSIIKFVFQRQITLAELTQNGRG
jgi:c-di-GMP-binding flagellar brake protein YcgR